MTAKSRILQTFDLHGKTLKIHLEIANLIRENDKRLYNCIVGINVRTALK